MPDLSEKLARWRDSVRALVPHREDVLDELESHLCELVDARIAAGDPTDEAFAEATSQIGSPEEIAIEFAKVSPPCIPWLPVHVIWSLAGVVCGMVLVWITPRFTEGGVQTLLAIHMGSVLLGYTATVFVGLLAACFLIARLRSELPAAQGRFLLEATQSLTLLSAVLTAAGMGCGLLCPLQKRGLLWGWSLTEAGGVAILLWDLWMFRLLVRRGNPIASLNRLMACGIVGNIVVVAGWLVASLVDGYIPRTLLACSLIAGLVALHLPIAGAALMPAGWLRSKPS